MSNSSSRLAAAGVEVHWPRELARSLTATAVVRPAPGSATDGTSFFDAERLFAFDWQLSLGDERLTEAEMDALAEAHRPVVRLRDQWVVVDPALVRKARKRELGLLDPVDALAVALTGSAEVDGERVDAVPAGALAALRTRILDQDAVIAPPPGLDATLRDYQLRGLAWLDRMTSLGLGGCLADDMGLGKTITLIALHLHRAHPSPTLVRTAPPPSSATGTARSTASPPASRCGATPRRRPHPGRPGRRFRPHHVRDHALPGAAELAAQSWGLVVADEAQHVKNPHSSTARALRTIPAPARVALTGTPVENNLCRLWALLDWTTPGLLGPLSRRCAPATPGSWRAAGHRRRARQRGGRGTGSRAWCAPSCCDAGSPTGASPPSRPRPRPTTPSPSPASRPRSTRAALQARRRPLLPDGPAPGQRPVRPAAHAGPGRARAAGRPGPAQRGALPRERPAAPGLLSVAARDAFAVRFRPPLPPLPAPPHPGQPPSYPDLPGARDPLGLDHLATDAAARAHALLTTGRDPLAGLTAWQDAVRLAASRPTAGLTATTRALYRELAYASGRTTTDLARAVAGWRQGEAEGLAVLETPWDPPGPFDRARPALAAAGHPRFTPRRNHLTHPGGPLQLRFGRDMRWYGYESDPGAEDWWPARGPWTPTR
ncbi:hypothetical protein SCALM49S_08937 [Streptomyces californicus]